MPSSSEAQPAQPGVAERLRPGRHGLPPAAVQAHQRQRILAAIAAVCARRGYAATSVAEIAAAAGVSRKTFYDLFDGKEQCLLAAHDELRERLLAAIDAAWESTEPEPERRRAALNAALASLAADLPGAQLLLLDILALGPQGAARYHALLDALHTRLQAAGPGGEADWAALALIAARVARAASENDPGAILALRAEFTALHLQAPAPAST